MKAVSEGVTGRTTEVQVTQPRVEIKVPVPAMSVPDIRAWVRLHPAHFRRTYPRRQVNNIYFDTPTYGGLNANLGGLGERSKLRLRWYGPCLDTVRDAQLEVKRKSGFAGWKEIFYLPEELSLELRSMPWSRIIGILGSVEFDAAAQWLMGAPVPVLINAYERDYYATSDGVLRLTIDGDLCAYGQRASAYPNLSVPAPLGKEAVVELKAPNHAAAMRRLNHALGHSPFPATRFSKYVQGMIATPDFG